MGDRPGASENTSSWTFSFLFLKNISLATGQMCIATAIYLSEFSELIIINGVLYHKTSIYIILTIFLTQISHFLFKLYGN